MPQEKEGREKARRGLKEMFRNFAREEGRSLNFGEWEEMKRGKQANNQLSSLDNEEYKG